MAYNCKNCQDTMSPIWRVPFCASCRRAASLAFIAGGFATGVLVKLLTLAGLL